MPWNNESGGGGWKSGGGNGGPWGQGGGGGGQGGGGQNNPDLEEMLKRSQDRVKQVMHGGGGGLPGPLVFLGSLVALAVIGYYAFTFTVKEDELGIRLRFGEFVGQAGPGIHFRFPYPVEEILLPKVTRENITQIGFRSFDQSRNRRTTRQNFPEESLMLTGDQNIVDINFQVVWRIKEAEDYLFNIQNPEQTVRDVSESAMREVVGKSDIEPILTKARQALAADVLTVAQKALDDYGSGIVISQVNVAKVDPPEKVIEAFRDVETARADQDRLRNEALADANRVVPVARGEAERILQKAEGYRDRIINEATGEAVRFEKVYDEYRKAPEVTRKRIFLETMERVFKGTNKIILDSKGGSGVVPYLPLNELTGPKKPAGGQ